MPRPCLLFSFHGHISGLPQHQQPKIRSPHLARSVFVSLCFLSFILLCVLSSVAAASGAELSPGWVSWRYPSPRSNPEDCGWTDVVQWAGDSIRNISWICDPDHLLGYSEAYDLALILENYHQESSCECPYDCSHEGYQIGIALVDRLNTDGEFEPMKVKAKNFADEVRVSWFADYGCDDNVLIFYGYYDDELYISIGKKTEQVISDLELVRLTERGDGYLTGEPITQPPPQDGAQPSNNTFTVVPTTTDFGARKTSTYAGMVPLVGDVQAAIVNGQSISSQIVYAAAIPVLLVLMIIIMCLLANWCCRPDYGYHQPEERPLKKTDDDDEEDEDDEEDDEKEEDDQKEDIETGKKERKTEKDEEEEDEEEEEEEVVKEENEEKNAEV